MWAEGAEELQQASPEEGAAEEAGSLPEPESTGAGEPAGEVNLLGKDVAELRAIAAERDRLFERLQRVTAELENYRKRVQREREQWRRYALEDFLRDLLPTIDNLSRAIEAARDSGDPEGLLDGLELIDRELHQTLSRYGVSPIEALGRPFDPFEHEAVEMAPAGEGETPGTVTAVLQRGYRLRDRVLRPSRVRVAQAPPQAEVGEEQGPGSEGSAERSETRLDIT